MYDMWYMIMYVWLINSVDGKGGLWNVLFFLELKTVLFVQKNLQEFIAIIGQLH